MYFIYFVTPKLKPPTVMHPKIIVIVVNLLLRVIYLTYQKA